MKKFTHLLTLAMMSLLYVGISSCGGEPDPRHEELQNDITLMKRNISETDTTTFRLKSILDLASMDGFDVDNFEYYTEIREDKALILVRIPEIRNIEKGGKVVFLDIIESMTEDGEWAGKDRYIGVFGKLGVNMSSIPGKRKEKLALKADLYDFYGPAPVEVE
jgi:hypothetical protein